MRWARPLPMCCLIAALLPALGGEEPTAVVVARLLRLPNPDAMQGYVTIPQERVYELIEARQGSINAGRRGRFTVYTMDNDLDRTVGAAHVLHLAPPTRLESWTPGKRELRKGRSYWALRIEAAE